MSRLPSRPLLLAAALGLGLPLASAAQEPLRVERIPNAFRDLDLSEEAVVLPLEGDEDGVMVEIGFAFPFFGATETVVTVTTNGYLTFGNAVNPLNEPIPSAFPPDGLLAPFWDDLDLRPGPNARVVIFRAPGVLVVQWSEVARKADPAARLSFQVFLFATGEVHFRYGPLRNGDGSTGGPAAGASATIGVEGPAGEAGVALAFEAPVLDGRTAWALRPAAAGFAVGPGEALGDLDGDGRVTVLDQSRFAELGHVLYPPATARELLLADVLPESTADAFGGDGRLDAADRDLLSQVIVGRADLGPYLARLDPERAVPGGPLVLRGSGFDPAAAAQNVVTVPVAGGGTRDVPATAVDPAGTRLDLVLPSDVRRGPVRVTARGRRTQARDLAVVGVPAVTAVAPEVGVVGEEAVLTVLEVGPDPADVAVTIGGAPAAVTDNASAATGDARLLTVTVPALAAGVHDVVVTAAGGGPASEPFRHPFGDRPTAEITAPAADFAVRDRTPVVGTASDPSDFARYALAVARLEGEPVFRTVAAGDAPVTADQLALFDPTLLINGYYLLRLTVTDALGLEATDEVAVSVQGDLKLGHFTLSFLDLELPAPGVAIRVRRDYDSRDEVRRDFGVGWRLRLVTLDLEEARDHDVIVDNPVSSRTEYRFTPEQINPLDPRFFEAEFTATEARELSRLEFETPDGVDEGNEVLARDSVGNFLFFPEGIPFDPVVYRIVQADGTVLRVHDTDDLLQVLTAQGPTLTITPDGLIHSAGRSVLFARDDLGRITEITDPKGNTLEYAYSPRGDLVAHTDREGHTSTFTYRDGHHLEEWTGPAGTRVTKNEYDDAGRLVATVDAFGERLEFEHDLDGRREVVRDRLGRPTVTRYDARGRAVRITGPDGKFEAFVHDARDRVLERRDREGGLWVYAYDARGYQSSMTDPEGDEIQWTYDARGNLLEVIDADGGVTTYAYDAKNRVTKWTGPAGGEETRTYDAQGNLTSVTDAAGQTTELRYGAKGDLRTRIDPTGEVTRFARDPNGNVTKKTKTTPVPGEDPRVEVTTMAYDAAGRRTEVVRPDGTWEKTRYGPGGKVAEEVDSQGRKQSFAYDAAGRLEERIGQDGRVEAREYDPNGHVVAVEDRFGRRTFEVDERGQPTEITHADGSTVGVEYDALGRITARTDARGNRWDYVRDGAGRVTELHDPEGGVTYRTYDGKGNVTSVTDPDGQTTTFRYDAAGRLEETVFPDGRKRTLDRDLAGRIETRTDPTGEVTEFRYDHYTDEDQVTRGDPACGGLGGAADFARDGSGRVLASTDLNGHTTRFAYDPATGDRTGVTLPLGQEATFVWDDGQIVQRHDFNGDTTRMAHDGHGNLVFRVFPDGTGERLTWSDDGLRVEEIEDAAGTLRLQYDASQRLAFRTEPDGRRVGYGYDPEGNVETIETPEGTVTMAYDRVGRLASVTDVDSRTTTYGYTPGGKLESIERPNGVRTDLELDPMGRVLQLSHTRGAAVIASYTYGYDAAGRRTSAVEASGRRVTYGYDDLGRLAAETTTTPAGDEATVAYTYDPMGNRETKTTTRPDGSVEARVYAYDANDRLLEEQVTDTGPAGDHTVTYTHDQNGNRLARVAPGETTTYTYDALDRLTAVVVERGAERHEVAYRYDHFGNRVETVRDGVVTKHLVDVNRRFARVLADTDASGNVVRIYGQGRQPLSVTDAAGATHYLLQDGQLSVRTLTDALGQVSGGYDFDAYGVLLEERGAVDNPVRYTGEQTDPTTGLVYLRSRWLDPLTGRFLTRDRFEGVRDVPETLNRYVYALGDPVNLIDPPGTFPTSLAVVFAWALPSFMAQLDMKLQELKLRAEAFKVGDLLGSLNLFLPKALDLLGQDGDFYLAQGLLYRALSPEAREDASTAAPGFVPLPTGRSRSYLFGAKVYGRMGADLVLGPAHVAEKRDSAAYETQVFDARRRRDELIHGAASDSGSRKLQLPLFQEIRDELQRWEQSGAIHDLSVLARQENASGFVVGANLVDFQFTIAATQVRWALVLTSEHDRSTVERMVTNDPEVLACALAEDATLADFLQALRYQCDPGPPAPFVLSLKPTAIGTPGVVKEAIPVRNKRAPLPQNRVVLGAGVLGHSGEFVLSRTDLTVPGRGPHWTFRRTYRSGLVFPNDPDPLGLKATFRLGHNWSTNYDFRLGNGGSGAILELDPLGRRADEHRRALEALDPTLLIDAPPNESPPGVFQTVIQTGIRFLRFAPGEPVDDTTAPEEHVERGYIRRAADGRLQRFNAAGWLVSITDRHGNRISLVRDDDQLLRLAIDTLGREYRYRYREVQGQETLVAVVDVTGDRQITFDYDEDTLDLLAVTSPGGRREEYRYSSGFENPVLNHNLEEVIFPEQVADGDRTPAVVNTYQTEDPTAYDFDSVVSQRYGGEIDVTGIADGEEREVSAGGTATFDYSETSPFATVAETNTVAVVTDYRDRRGELVRFSMNRGGNPLEVVDEAGFVTTHRYNEDGLVERTELPNGQRIFNLYDRDTPIPSHRGNLLVRVRFEAPTGGKSFQPIVKEYDYEPLFNQARRVSDTQAFEPVLAPPEPGEDPRSFLSPSTEFEHFTTRTSFDYQEGPRPALPGFLEQKFRFDLEEVLASREDAGERWEVPFGLGDLNVDGETGPTSRPDYSGPGIRGIAVHAAGPAVRLASGSLERARLSSPVQVAEWRTQYNARGQPTTVIDPEGNVTTTTYYPDGAYDPDTGAQPGYVQQVVRDDDPVPGVERTAEAAPAKATTVIRYDAFANRREVTDPIGTVYRTTWDPDGVPLEARRAAETEGLDYATRYAWNENLVLERVEVDDKGSEVENPRGFFERRLVYDVLNNVVEEGERLDTVEDGTITATEWLVTTHEYDPGELRTKTTLPEGGRNAIEWGYDDRRLRVRQTRAPGSPDASTERWAYDGNRNVVGRTLPDGDEVLIRLDGFDRPAETILPNGSVEARDYDPEGNLVEVKRFGTPGGPTPTGNDQGGNVLLAHSEYVLDDLYRVRAVHEHEFAASTVGPIASRTAVTTTEHDRLDRPHAVFEPDDELHLTEYDGLHRVAKETDALGSRTEYTYDDNSNVLTTTEIERASPTGAAGDARLIPDETFVTVFSYDPLNRVESITDPLSQVTRFRHDSRDNLVFSSDAQGPVLPDGTNGPGNTAHYRFDSVNRPVATIHDLRVGGEGGGALDTSNPTNPDGQVTLRRRYDKNSRLVAIVDDDQNVTEYGYDDLNRQTSKTNADGESWTYVYREDDTLDTVTDPNGTVTSHTYDVNDRLIAVSVARADGVAGTTSQTFQYDGLDRLTRATDDNGEADPARRSVVERAWDSRSRLLTETQNDAVVANEWAIDHKRLACTYPGGRRIATTFDAIDRPTIVSDPAGEIARCDWIGRGLRELRRRNGDGTTVSRLDDPTSPTTSVGAGYDEARRLIRQRCLRPDATAFLDREYGYNRANRRSFERRHQDAGLTDRYAYDSLYRIEETELDREGAPTATARDTHAYAYQLDGVGNRREETRTRATDGQATTIGFTVNAVNEYVERFGVARPHSDNGNLLEDDRFQYAYDFKNRLVAVSRKSDGALVAQYTYDALDRRVRKDVAAGQPTAGVTLYFYDGQRVCEERVPAEQPPEPDPTTTTFVYSPLALDCVIQVQREADHPLGPATLYLHQNARYDVAAVTEEGAVVERRLYDDFGRTYDAAKDPAPLSAVGNPYGFQGRRLDPETGLYYFRNRYYDPDTGRFLQRDPLWDPGNWGNQYTFVGNSPATFTDPTGEIGPLALVAVGIWGGMELAGWWASSATGDPELEVAPSQQLYHAFSGESVYGGEGQSFQGREYSGGERLAEGARGASATLAPFAVAGVGGRALLGADAAMNVGLGAYDWSQGHTVMGPLQTALGAVGLGGLRGAGRTGRRAYGPAWLNREISLHPSTGGRLTDPSWGRSGVRAKQRELDQLVAGTEDPFTGQRGPQIFTGGQAARPGASRAGIHAGTETGTNRLVMYETAWGRPQAPGGEPLSTRAIVAHEAGHVLTGHTRAMPPRGYTAQAPLHEAQASARGAMMSGLSQAERQALVQEMIRNLRIYRARRGP